MIHAHEAKYKNVELRQLNETDLELLREWRNNPENTKYLRKLRYITKEMQKVWYKKYLIDQDEMTFAIIESDELKRVVGSLSLYNFDDKKTEFGKILVGDTEAHGKHVGTNALKAVLLLAFNKLQLKEVYLHVYANNKAAVHSYEQAGLAIIDKHAEESELEYVMSITREDFLSKQEVKYA